MTNYAHPEYLVSTQWVADHLTNPRIRVVEVDVDTAVYDTGHIPGAVGWNWKNDLQTPVERNIASKEEIEELFSHSGISNDTIVILYGDASNWFAAYALWLLQYYGHEDVRLMNGGRKKWIAEGRPLTMDVPSYQPTNYKAKEPDLSIRALRDYVWESIGRDEVALVDVRSPREFAGELVAPAHLPQEGSQRGGHIPGAKNVPWFLAVNEDGTFKDANELARIYQEHGIIPNKEVIAYCRIGERSSHTWFVLKHLLGYPNVRNYDGSWAEWGSLIGAPIERSIGTIVFAARQ